jgi:mono/diheme cytochrome c family protein
LLRFIRAQGNIPSSEVQLLGQGDGTFTSTGSFLSLPGNWQVQAVVRREDKFDAFANFDFKIQRPGSEDKNTAASKQTGGLLLTIGLLSTLITFTMQTHRPLRLGLGIPLSVLMISFGVVYLTRPVVIENVQANPIHPDGESIATGSALFITNCGPCHGVDGKGDGPVGLTMNPRPADLTQHAIPGVHTDAQLYEWITNGFPGTRMPAFKSVLSDTDRWHLVNFIRTFAPK